MNKDELKNRTKQFAHRCLDAVESLPEKRTARILGDQLARSSTSVAANYRAACRARSRNEFISKMGTVEEEVDESEFWISFIQERGLIPAERLEPLRQEASELTAIMTSSRKTARAGA